MAEEEKAEERERKDAAAAAPPSFNGDASALLEWVKREAEAARELHAADKLYQACDALKAIREALAANEAGRAEAEAWLDAQAWVGVASEEREMSDRLLAEFLNDDGWDVARDAGGRQTMYRSEEELGTHSFKVRGVINAPLVHVSACLLEVGLYKLWFPMCCGSETLAHPSRYRKVARVTTSCPWPVSNRETLVEGFGVEALERGMVIVNIKSVEEYPGVPEEELAVQRGNVRAIIHSGGFLMQPISREAVQFTMMINVDPKLPVIPFSVLNWFSGKLISFILSSIESAATSFDPNASKLTEDELAAKKKKNKKFKGEDSPFVEAIRANADIYQYMADTFEEYFVELDRKAAAEAGSEEEDEA